MCPAKIKSNLSEPFLVSQWHNSGPWDISRYLLGISKSCFFSTEKIVSILFVPSFYLEHGWDNRSCKGPWFHYDRNINI